MNRGAILVETPRFCYYLGDRPLSTLYEEPFLLGNHNAIAYYFIYDKDAETTLDKTFLSGIRTKADHYVIYADRCIVSDEKLMRFNITFKKIPRDIPKM